MTEIPARQPAGIPVGGQFAATAHAEPQVTLAPTAVTPDEQKELLDALNEKRQELDRLQDQLDLMHIDASIGWVRRHFPDAAKLHVSRSLHGWTGQPLDSFEPKSIRDKNGNDITPDDKHWHLRRTDDDDQLDPGAAVHLYRLSNGFFSYEHEGVGYDTETSTFVIDMDHKFSA